MKVSLLVASGVHEGQMLRMDGVRLLIGRGSQCHVRPNSPQVDVQHCGLFVRGKDLFLRDLDSKTGTFLNGRRLRGGEIELRDGDLFQAGPLSFAVVIEADPVAPSQLQKRVMDEPRPSGSGFSRQSFERSLTVAPHDSPPLLAPEETVAQATDDLPPDWLPAMVEPSAANGEALMHHAPETQEMPALVPETQEMPAFAPETQELPAPVPFEPEAENGQAAAVFPSPPAPAPAVPPPVAGESTPQAKLLFGYGARPFRVVRPSVNKSRAPT